MEKLDRPLVEVATEAIIAFIRDNQLQVGDRLPNEFNLAKEINVGRSTVREAVRTLVSRNILEVKQGSGTYVSEQKGIVEDPLGFTLVSDALKLTQDLFEVRYLLEPRSAMLAAENGTDKQIEELNKLRLEMEESLMSGDDRHRELDIQFHKLIAKMSQNLAMEHLVPVINESINLNNDYYTNDMVKKDTIESHYEIYKAILDRRPVDAYDAMMWHISCNLRNLKEQK